VVLFLEQIRRTAVRRPVGEQRRQRGVEVMLQADAGLRVERSRETPHARVGVHPGATPTVASLTCQSGLQVGLREPARGAAQRARVVLHRRGLRPLEETVTATEELRPLPRLQPAQDATERVHVPGRDPAVRQCSGERRHLLSDLPSLDDPLRRPQ
jgi:hypothetical protein